MLLLYIHWKFASSTDLPDSGRFTDRSFSIEGVTQEQLRTVVEWQLAKECMKLVKTLEQNWVELTELGLTYREGTPEQRIVAKVREAETIETKDLMQIEGLSQKEAGTALGALKKSAVLMADKSGSVQLAPDADLESIEKMGQLIAKVANEKRVDLESLPDQDQQRVLAQSRKRGKSKGIFRIHTDQSRVLELTQLGQKVRNLASQQALNGDQVNLLTSEMLLDGSWRGKTFRPFNLAIPPARRVAGRRNPYREFLDFVRRKLISLGFEEMRGEMVETEFWNNDALFMPQFHSARDIHDVYFVKNPTHAKSLEEPYASACRHRRIPTVVIPEVADGDTSLTQA